MQTTVTTEQEARAPAGSATRPAARVGWSSPKGMLNPGLGLEKLFKGWSFANFKFDRIIDERMAIYTVVIAGVWQASGFVMAMFLAGLRCVDQDLIKAASIDGASLPRIYRRIIIPQLRPVFLSAVVILAHLA